MRRLIAITAANDNVCNRRRWWPRWLPRHAALQGDQRWFTHVNSQLCLYTVYLVTERSRLLDPDYRTVFHGTWKTLTYRTMNSGGR